MGADEYDGPLGYVFAVAERPFCCWDDDHEGRTMEFLKGLATGHFEKVAAMLAEQLESDDRLAASVALRVTYHQGLETLFSLLGAATQAPAAVPAWIASCTTDDLKKLVGSFRDGAPMLTQAGRVRVSFSELSLFIHRFAWADETGIESTAARFAQFWRRLSGDLLDDKSRAEYNALKHGNRVVPGGFTLAIGIEEAPGVPAPPDSMWSLGGSNFGSTFFVTERVGVSKQHIRMRRTSVNWAPLLLAQRLVLISMSITNVVGALCCGLGAEPGTVQFFRPNPPSAFDDVWLHEPSVKSTSIDTTVEIGPADELSAQRLIEILERRAT